MRGFGIFGGILVSHWIMDQRPESPCYKLWSVSITIGLIFGLLTPIVCAPSIALCQTSLPQAKEFPIVENPDLFKASQGHGPRPVQDIFVDPPDDRDTDISKFINGIGIEAPSVRVGYTYTFGDKVNEGSVVTDFVVRFKPGQFDAFFAQSRGEWRQLNSTFESNTDKALQASIGVGYRRLVRRDLLVGVNTFYDGVRFNRSWRPSAGAGLEVASTIAGSSVIDLSLNYYGDLFAGGSSLTEFFKEGTPSIGAELGYTQPLADLACAVRLKIKGYRLEDDSGVNGWATGVDWTNCDNSLVFMYEYGNDETHGNYHSIRGTLNLLFEPERILKLESPFAIPNSDFIGYRILQRYMGALVRRDYPAILNQPGGNIDE